MRLLVQRSLTLRGFIVGNLRSKYVKEFYETYPKLVASGEIKYLEDAKQGLKDAWIVLVSESSSLEEMGLCSVTTL